VVKERGVFSKDGEGWWNGWQKKRGISLKGGEKNKLLQKEGSMGTNGGGINGKKKKNSEKRSQPVRERERKRLKLEACHPRFNNGWKQGRTSKSPKRF